MKILFIAYIPDLINLFVLFCSLRTILNINVLYIVSTFIVILGGLALVKYSKFGQGLKNGGKIILAGGAAKGGSDLYDLGKEKIKGILDGLKKGPENGSNPNPNPDTKPNPNTNPNPDTNTNTNTNGKKIK